jgi:DNA-binding MurR/RpiR family transcriptional regulator
VNIAVGDARRSGFAVMQPLVGSSAAGQEWLKELVNDGHVTPKGQTVAHFIAANPQLAAFSPATALAAKSGVNVATVVRFAQSLGFSGWPEFQLHFRHRYLGSLPIHAMPPKFGSGTDDSPMRSSIRRDIQNLEAALISLDTGEAEIAARTIAEAPRTLVVSSGSYAAVGHVLAHIARFMGYDITLEMRGGADIVSSVSKLRRGDCLVAISFWHVIKHVVMATNYCRRRGITTIAITDSIFSRLAKEADHTLVVPTETGSFFQSSTAALSVVYGLLDRLHALGGDATENVIENAFQLFEELDVAYT